MNYCTLVLTGIDIETGRAIDGDNRFPLLINITDDFGENSFGNAGEAGAEDGIDDVITT